VPGLRPRIASGVRARRVQALAFLGLVVFSCFFLVRPFLDAAPAYRPRPPGTAQAYSFLVVAAFVPYALAVWAAGRAGIGLRWAVGGTLLLHAAVLPAALTQSQDLYAYLFYGKMWSVHGANPYIALPVEFASDPWFAWMRWPDQPTVYGPLWTVLTAAPVSLARTNLPLSFVLMKLILLLLGTAAVSGLVRAGRDRGVDPAMAVLMVGWNPLVIVSLPLGGHADAAVLAAVPWALLADRRGRPVLAALLLAAATLVKAYAGLVLLVYLVALVRRSFPVAARAAGVSIALAAAAWFPFWSGAETFSGLVRIGGEASSSLGGTVQLALSAVLGDETGMWAVRVAGVAVIIGVLLLVVRREDFHQDPWPGATAVFAAYLAVTPWFLPWHLVGLLPLAAVAASGPLRAAAFTFSGTASLTASFGGAWWGRAGQAAIRYGVPAGAWLSAARRPETARTRGRSPQRLRS
jgi:hypothetical protein